jgi:hypothetical protein
LYLGETRLRTCEPESVYMRLTLGERDGDVTKTGGENPTYLTPIVQWFETHLKQRPRDGSGAAPCRGTGPVRLAFFPSTWMSTWRCTWRLTFYIQEM